MPLFALILSAGLMATRPSIASLPDPAGGVLNGRVALMFWPGLMTQNGLQPIPKEECTVHLALVDDQARESVYPCGDWFLPPTPARYLQWLEQADFLSYQTVVGYAGEPFHGRGLVSVSRLYPASSARLDPRVKLRPDETFRFVSLGTGGDRLRSDRLVPAARSWKAAFHYPR